MKKGREGKGREGKGREGKGAQDMWESDEEGDGAEKQPVDSESESEEPVDPDDEIPSHKRKR